jgi:DedD protein
MSANQEKKKNTSNKLRNQLIGFATLLLIIAIIAPYIITDKSNLNTPTIPILQPEVINEQNQSNVLQDKSIINGSYSDGYEQAYAPDSEQYISPLASPAIIDNNFTASNTTTNSEQADKLYMIQLGALKNKKKIEELVALLRLNNYNVRTIPNNPGPNQLIKLQVGPYAKKEQAEHLISNLKNLTKLKGVIVTN